MKRKILVSLLIFAMLFTQNSAALAVVLDAGQSENSAAQPEEAAEDPAEEMQEAVSEPEENTPAEEIPEAAGPEAKAQVTGDKSAQNPAPEAAPGPAEITDSASTVDNPMAITASPESVKAEEGDTITFTAEARTTLPQELSYQWQKSVQGAGASDTPQSTDEALAQKQDQLDEIEEAAASETQKKKAASAVEEAPIAPDSQGWEDIPGATEKSLTITVDHEAATRATSYRMVARTTEAALATAPASVYATTLFAAGAGTEDDPYQIQNADQLGNIGYMENANIKPYFRLIDDIDLTGRVWIPLRGRYRAFGGILDGNGFTVKGMTINNWGVAFSGGEEIKKDGDVRLSAAIVGSGFIAESFGAVIKNLYLEDININYDSSNFMIHSYSTGGIVGFARETVIENCAVTGKIRVHAKPTLFGPVNNYVAAGGITGWAGNQEYAVAGEGTVIKNCYADVNIEVAANGGAYQGQIYPVSPLGTFERNALGKDENGEKTIIRKTDQPPVVENCYYKVEKSSGGGTPKSVQAFEDSEVLGILNNYVDTHENLNSWEQPGGVKLPQLIPLRLNPVDLVVRNHTKTWNGQPQKADVTAMQNMKEGIDWVYRYERDGQTVDNPTEIGNYEMLFDIATPERAKIIRINSVKSDPAIPGLKTRTSRLVIRPKDDTTAPVIRDIRYTKTDGGTYTPGSWSRQPVTVSFFVEDPAVGKTEPVLCGDETLDVDAEHTEVSGVNPEAVTVVDPAGQTYSAQRTDDGRYSLTLSATEARSIDGSLTLKVQDKSGNETTAYTDILRLSQADIAFSVRAFKDGDSQGAALENPDDTDSYLIFAKNQVNFEISARTALKDGETDKTTVNKIEYQLTPDGSQPAEDMWSVQTFNDSQKVSVVTMEARKPFNGRLYVRAVSSSGHQKMVSYRFMVDKSAPAIALNTAEGRRFAEDNSTEASAVYNSGEYYSAVRFGLNLSDAESGIVKASAVRSDNGAALEIMDGQNLENTPAGQPGIKTDTITINCNQQGSYKARVTVTDKAGNETTWESETVYIDQEAPQPEADWVSPGGKTPAGEDYGFNVWSDKAARISLTNKNADVKADVVYYYRSAPQGTADWSDWKTVNQKPQTPGEAVSLTIDTQGAYTYAFKAVSATMKTGLTEAKTIMMDTAAPDAVVMTPNGEANQNNWYNRKITVKLAFDEILSTSPETAEYETWWKSEDTPFGGKGQKIDGSSFEWNGTTIQDWNLCGSFDQSGGGELFFARDGVYTVTATSKNRAGKTTVVTKTFRVDTTAPRDIKITYNGYTLGNLMHFLSFGAFGKSGQAMTIDTIDSCSGFGGAEYQIVEKDANADDALWKIYDRANKPVIPTVGDAQINVRAWDKADNAASANSNTVRTENEKPALSVVPRQDTTVWQQEMTFDVTVQDVDSGIKTIEVQDYNQTGDGYKTNETYTIPYDPQKAPESQAGLIYQGAAPVEGAVTKVDTLPDGATGERDLDTGLLTNEVTFTLTRRTPSVNRNTPNSLRVMITDRAGNQTSQTLSYKIDNAKPAVKAAADENSVWKKDRVTVALSLTNEAPENQSTVDKTKTLSPALWYYRMGTAAQNADQPDFGWRSINAVPAYGEVRFDQKDNYNGEIYFRAVSQSGVDSGESGSDNYEKVAVKIDKVNPQNAEVKVMNQTNSQDSPDGDNSWYKTQPELSLVSPVLDEDNGAVNDPNPDRQRSPISTWYQLNQDGREGEATPMGAAISGGLYTDTKDGIGQNKNSTDQTSQVARVSPVNLAGNGAPDNSGADGNIGAANITAATGAAANVGAPAAVADLTEKDCALGGILENGHGVVTTYPAELASQWNTGTWTMVSSWSALKTAINQGKKKIRLSKDISCTDTGTSEIALLPVGTILDGQGYKITGVDKTNAALFKTNQGAICNLVVENPKFKPGKGVPATNGLLVNYMGTGAFLYNCHVIQTTQENGVGITIKKPSVPGTGSYDGIYRTDNVGSIAGEASINSKVSYCTSNLSMTSEAPADGWSVSLSGGLIGEHGGDIDHCAYTGTIKLDNGVSIGGIVGDGNQSGTIRNCYVSGSVTAERGNGGIAGRAMSYIGSCHVKGLRLESIDRAGGILGYEGGSSTKGGIENCLVEDTALIVNNAYGTAGGITSDGYGEYLRSCTVRGTTITGHADSIKMGGIASGTSYAQSGITGCLVEDVKITGGFGIGGILSRSDMNIKSIDNCRVSKVTLNVLNGGRPASASSSEVYGQGGILGGMGRNTDKVKISNCTVDNLTLKAPETAENTGGITGLSIADNIENCKVTGKTTIEGGKYTGGIVGLVEQNITISQCAVDGEVSLKGTTHVGGAAGEMSMGLLENTQISGAKVSGSGSCVGGAVGTLVGHARNNAVDSTVTVAGAGEAVGGFAGQAIQSVLEESTTGAAVTNSGSKSTGGFLGTMVSSGSATRCLATGEVTGSTKSGGFIGNAENLAISNCRSEGNVKGKDQVGGFIGRASAISLVRATSKGAVTAAEDNAGGLVGLVEGNAVSIRDSMVDAVDKSVSGRGNIGGLAGKTENTADNTPCLFTGCKVITGEVKASGDNAGGLIGYALCTVRLTNSTASPARVNGQNQVGGAVGNMAGNSQSLLTSVQVGQKQADFLLKSVEKPQISGVKNIGGLIGYADKVDVSRCETTAAVTATGENAGGAVGMAGSAVFSTCNAKGDVSGADYVGGFTGRSVDARYENAVALGSVQGTRYVGGFAGSFEGNMISNCGAGGAVSGNAIVGSFVGQNYDTGGSLMPTVPGDGQYTLKYWTEDAAGNVSQTGLRSFKVDTTPPDAPAIDINGAVYTGVKTGTANTSEVIKDCAQVMLKSQDAGSGLDRLEYGAQNSNNYDAFKAGLKTVNADQFGFAVNPAFTGYVYAKATDNAGNTAESYSGGFKLETTKYITKATTSFNPTPVNGWATGSVTFNLSCTTGNGTAATAASYEYSKDGGAWQAVTGTFLTLNDEGDSGAYRFRAVIASVDPGDILETEAIPVQMDMEAPEAVLEVLPETPYKLEDNTLIYTDTVGLKASASDTASGVASLEYQLSTDTASWRACDGLIVIPTGFDGTVSVRATDKAGKISDVAKTERFIVNNRAPAQPAISASDSYDLAAGPWTGNDITLKAAAPSGDTSIKAIEYQQEDSSWAAMPVQGIILNTSGVHTFVCRSVGYNGVVSTPVSAVVRINKDVPDINVQVSGHAAANTEAPFWTNEAVSFDLTTENGVSLWDGTAELGSASKHEIVRVTADGKHGFSFTSKNNVGAASTPADYTVWLDQIAPAAPQIEATGTPDAKGWYKDDLKLAIMAAPKLESDTSSAETVWYRVYKQGVTASAYAQINAGDELPALKDDGIYVVEAYTADAAGNQSGVVSKTIKKTSETKEGELVPVITLVGELAADTLGKIYKSSVTAELSAISTGNALACIEYQWADTGSALTPDNWQRYSEANKPVFENVAGTLYARAVDAAGKTTAAGSYAAEAFISDTRRPSVFIEGAEGVVENTWVQGPATLSLKGGSKTKDGRPVLSGFDHYEVSMDNGESWLSVGTVENAGSYEVNVSGRHNILARSVSAAGHAGDTAAYSLWIDNTGQPGSGEAFDIELESVKTGGDAANGWYNRILYTTRLKEGSNVPSGVRFYYSEDNKDWTPMEDTALVLDKSTTQDGKTYYFKGVSGVGVESEVLSDRAKIDTVSPAQPVLSITEEGWLAKPPSGSALENLVSVPDADRKNMDKDGESRSAVRPQLRIEKEGEASQVKDFDESADNMPVLDTGIYRLVGRSVDSAGNVSDSTGIRNLKIDTDAPEVEEVCFSKINDSSAARFLRAITFNTFFKEETKIEIKAKDTGSGVKAITWEVVDSDTDAVIQKETRAAAADGSVQFTLLPKAAVYVRAVAEDGVGLISDEKTSGNILLEADKPVITVETGRKPNAKGWYTSDVPFTVKAEDRDSGLAELAVYVNESGTPEGMPVFEKKDYTQADKVALAESLTASAEGRACIVARAVDQAGNTQVFKTDYGLEKGLSIAASMTVAKSAGQDLDNSDAPVGQISVPYNGEVTSRPVTVHIQTTDPVTGTEPLSGIEKIEVAETGSDGTPVSDWQSVSSPAVREHYVDAETDSWYVFRAVTFAGNIRETSPQQIVISRALPQGPAFSVTLDGEDVNSQWVNRAPEVRVNTPGCNDAAIRSRTEYCYVTTPRGGIKDNSRSGTLPVSQEGDDCKLPEVTDSGVYSLEAWAQDKEGVILDSDNMATAGVWFDNAAPTGADFGYRRENTDEGSRIILIIQVQDEASGGKSVDYEYTDTAGKTVGGTLRCMEDEQNRGAAFLEIEDIAPGTTVKVTKAVDHAGNVFAPPQPVESSPIEPGEIPGVDVAFTQTPVPNAWGWSNAERVTVGVTALAKGNGIYRPASSGELDDDGNMIPAPEENGIDSITYTLPDGSMRTPENGVTPGGKEAAFDILVGPEAQGIITLPVTVYDTWRNMSTASYTFRHDSLAPKAPEVTLTAEDKPLRDEITGSNVLLTVEPDHEGESDSTSPFVSWQYSSDNGNTWSEPIAIEEDNPNSLKFTFDSEKRISDGQLVVRINDAADNFGIASAPVTLRMKDTTAPEKLTLTERDSSPVTGDWQTTGESRILKVTAVDPSDGVISDGLKDWQYSLDGGETWTGWQQWQTVQDNTLAILEDGSYEVTFKMRDGANNEMVYGESKAVRIDRTAPIFEEIRITGEKRADGAYTGSVDYTIPVADAVSGLKRLTIRVNDSEQQVVECPETTAAWEMKGTLEKDGRYRIALTAEDNAGFMAETYYDILIDQHAPEIYPLSPKNGAIDVDTGTGLSIMADEPMQKGDGYITLYEAETGAVAAELHSSNNRVVIDGKMILISLPQPLKVNTGYYAVAGAGFVCDTNGNPSAEIGGKDAWKFKTKADDSKVTILGFKAEHIRRLPDSEETSELLAAVVDNQNPRNYNILTPADYVADDGKAYVKLVITPLYNAAPKDLEIRAVNKDGKDVSDYITQNEDNTFTIMMPNTEEKADITISIGSHGENKFNVVILNKSYQAVVNAQDVEAEADQGELLNSVDLTEEAQNSNVTKVNIVLNIAKQDLEAIVEEEIEMVERAMEEIRESLKGESCEAFYLDINMLKQVTIITEDGEAVSEEMIIDLQNPINITLTIPEEIRGEYVYHVIRIHQGQTDVLIPEILEDGTKLSFATDRFSTYAITATEVKKEPDTPEEPTAPEAPAATPQAEDIANADTSPETTRSFRLFSLPGSAQSAAENSGTAQKPEATKKIQQTDHEKENTSDGPTVYEIQKDSTQHTEKCIVHYILLVLALILAFVFEWDLRRRKKKLEAEQQQDENGGEKDV